MKTSLVREGLLLLLLLGLIPSAGCQTPEMFSRNPDKYDKSQYGVTSHERSEQLKKLAKEVSSLPVAEQQQLSDQLYRDLGQEKSPILRLYMVRALSRMETPAASAALVIATKDQDRDVKIEACRALGNRPGPESLRVLTEVVGSENDIDVRLAATQSLGRMQHPQAIAGLAIALDDADPAMQRRAVEGLKDVTGENLGNDVNAWQQYVKSQTPSASQQEQSLADRTPVDRYPPWQ